jgi:4-aminobutyrate aminotransferase
MGEPEKCLRPNITASNRILCVWLKGIGSGLPIGACVARADIMDWHKGAHASTFGGNPVCIASALKTIELLENGLTENAAS